MNRLAVLLCLAAAPLAAHPHVFVNTGIEVIVDAQDRLTDLRITWQYDELYSLLITEEYGVDADFDGVLDDADLEKLTGFDMNWVEGYNGDLVGALDGVALELSGPRAATVTLVEGKITTTHLRRVAGTPMLAGQTLSLKPFDATYYSAYEVDLPVTITGRDGCEMAKQVPDIDAALALTQAELSQLPADADVADAGFPEIGARFATEVTIRCPAGS